MTNWEDRILNHKTAVSDTVNFISSSASISCYDPDHGKIYAVYHASKTVYGESRDYLVLAIVPVGQPHRTENIVIIQDGVPVDGIVYHRMLEGNCIFLDGKVRIYFLNDDRDYYYVDFDPANKTFSKIQRVLCSYDGKTLPLTGESFTGYLDSRGMTGYSLESTRTQVINTGKMYFHEGFWYGSLTASLAQPVIYRSTDAVTFEFICIIDKLAKYETQTAIVDGRMYALLRGAQEDNFYISDDLGQSFTPCGRLEFNETRPQLLPYRGKLLIAVSLKGIEPNLVRDGRNNMKLLVGTGEDLSAYKDIFFIKDKYGIVYYDITDYKGVLYMIFSNADLYLDKNQQAKDLLYFTKIGDLSEYIEESCT